VKLNRNNVAFFFLAAAIAIPAFAQSGVDISRSRCLMCIGMDLADTNIGKGKMTLDTSFSNNGKLTNGQIKSFVAYLRTLQK
jgi:hypothetical protein